MVDVIGAITEFKRAGYTLEESKQLAETALIMTNVAEGITDAGTAANYLVSILKGANLEISYSTKLLDELNEISNTSAVNFDSLANMTQRIAGTMKTLGNSVEETMALVTGAYEVLQDERVAKGLSTIGLRIAGLNDDLEREAGLQSSVNKALEKYAGISIFDTTGQLRDTYDILTELAGVWDKLNVNVQTYLTTTLAGRNRADVLAAVLNNWEGVESAMASAMNSAGSALKEQQAYLDSIEGKQQALANAWQELADATLNSDVVKFFYDVLAILVKIVKNTGTLAGWLTTILGIVIAINARNITAKLISWGQSIKKIVQGLKAAKTAASGFSSALGGIGIALAAISTVVGIIKGVVNAVNARKEAEEEAKQAAIESNQATLDKLQQIRTEYKELSSKTKRTADEEKRLLEIQKSLVQNYGYLRKELDGVNGSYEQYLGLSAEAIIQKKKELYAATAEDYQQAIKGKETLLTGRGYSYSDRFYTKRYAGMTGRGYVVKRAERDLSEITLESIQERISELVKKNLTSYLTEEEASELSRLQSYITSVNSQLEVYNKTIEDRDKLEEEITKGLQDEINGTAEYNEKLNALKASLNSLINEQEKRLEQAKEEQENLKKQEKLQSALLKVEQARLGVAEARNKKMRVFRAGRGFVYEADESELESAQKTLTEALQSLSEYKYELALDNAENFVKSLSSTLTSPGIVAGWADLMEKFGDSFNDEFSDILESAKEFVREFNETIGETGEKISWSTSNPTTGVNGAYASGTLSAAGGISLVGEKGPELRMLNQGDGIIPARQTAKLLKMASGEGTGTIINVDKVEIIEPNNFDGFVSQFCSKLQLPTGGTRAPLGSY